MTTLFRSTAVGLCAGAAMTGLLFAQGAPAPAPQAPAGQPPAVQTPPAGRGAGRGVQAPPAGRGQRRGGFTQFTREVAPQDVLVRGQALYEANCASCHSPDLRGTAKASNVLRSGVVFNDKKGELIAASVAKHSPAITLIAADINAVAEYLHSVQATMGGQGSPPGRNPTNVTLNILVGDPRAGETQFSVLCANCHSGNNRPMTGIATKYPDPRQLQNAWFVGSGAIGGGGRGGGGGAGNPATLTLADGSKIQGTLNRQDDFLVIVTLADGTRRSFARDANGFPKVEVTDPRAAHKGMAMKLIFDDPENKKMHDITAYLATLK